MATADLTVIALGRAEASASRYIAEIQRRLAAQDRVRYTMHAMDLWLERSTADILALAGELHAVPFEMGIPRVYSILKLDERRDREQTLEEQGRLGPGAARHGHPGRRRVVGTWRVSVGNADCAPLAAPRRVLAAWKEPDERAQRVGRPSVPRGAAQPASARPRRRRVPLRARARRRPRPGRARTRSAAGPATTACVSSRQ